MQQIKVVREIPGEYLRAGEVYCCTEGRCRTECRNVARGSATDVNNWVLLRALKDGSVVLA